MLSGDHRYRMLVEELEEYAIFMVDQQGMVVTWNKGAQRVLGYDEAEIVGRSSDVFFTSQDLAEDVPHAELELAARDGRASDNRWHIRKNGSRVFISGVTLAMRDEDGQVSGFAKVMRDITLRKQTERRLAAQYAVTQILASADSLEDATIQVLEAICLTLDWEWAALWRAASGNGQLRCIDVYHRDPAATLPFETISRSTQLARGTGLPGRVWASGKTEWVPDVVEDGNFPRREIAQQCGLHGAVCFPVKVDAANVGAIEFISHEAFNPDPDLIRVMGNIGNQLGQFIERRRIERERADALAREQTARAEAEAASKAKDQFLAVLSHELRTPLTPILALASILSRDKTLPSELQDDIEMIRRNVELEARLIDDLLDLTRIARGKLRLFRKNVNVHELVGHVIEMCDVEMCARRIRFSTELNAKRCDVMGDPARLQQVLWNLLKNAIKFTPEGGSISIRSKCDGEQLSLSVIDNGIGLDAALLPKLFNAFEQGSPGVTRQFGGLGLGLAISKALIDAHGGILTAHSEGVGKGATFTVQLPLESTKAPVPQPGITSPIVTPSRPLSILLVEDHIDTQEMMARLLEGYGHHVQTADSVNRALNVAATGHFDLVISDLGLPDGSGLDLMHQLRARHGIRGIALSGYGMEDDIQRSRRAGFEHHLTKPITATDLETVLGQLVSASQEPQTAQFDHNRPSGR